MRTDDVIAANAPDLMAIDDARKAAWIWHPGEARMLWASEMAAGLFGTATPAALTATRFDRAMPAALALRRFAAVEHVAAVQNATAQTLDLLFWTAAGSRRLRCFCSPLAHGEVADAVLVVAELPIKGAQVAAGHRAGFTVDSAAGLGPRAAAFGNTASITQPSDAGATPRSLLSRTNGHAGPGPNGISSGRRQPVAPYTGAASDEDQQTMAEIARLIRGCGSAAPENSGSAGPGIDQINGPEVVAGAADADPGATGSGTFGDGGDGGDGGDLPSELAADSANEPFATGNATPKTLLRRPLGRPHWRGIAARSESGRRLGSTAVTGRETWIGMSNRSPGQVSRPLPPVSRPAVARLGNGSLHDGFDPDSLAVAVAHIAEDDRVHVNASFLACLGRMSSEPIEDIDALIAAMPDLAEPLNNRSWAGLTVLRRLEHDIECDIQAAIVPLGIGGFDLPVNGGPAGRLIVLLSQRGQSSFAASMPGTPDAAGPAEGLVEGEAGFFAKVSHEVRTPLNSIIGFAEMMQQERLGPVGNLKYRGYIDDIHQSAGHALSLINDLLDLSKIQAGAFQPDTREVDLAAVVAECVSAMRPQAERARVVLETRFSVAPPMLLFDPRSLKQIMLNLLSNAIKFTRPGGEVVVGISRRDGGAYKLRVRDTGIGMSGPDIARAMRPFEQLDMAPRRDGGGTGLGLPLTRALVEANRARFRVESMPGCGTVVEVELPDAIIAARPAD